MLQTGSVGQALKRAYSIGFLEPQTFRLLSSVVQKNSEESLSPLKPYPLKKGGLSVAIPPRAPAQRELGRLLRLAKKEGLADKFRTLQFHTTPSEQRVLDEKAAEKKQSKQKFRELMRYIMKRKERGF